MLNGGGRHHSPDYPKQPNCEPLIDADAAAAILGVHPKTVKRLAGGGQIPGMRIGKLWRFRESVLDAWMKAQLDC